MKKIIFLFVFILNWTVIFSKTGYYRLIISQNPSFGYTFAWCQINGRNAVVYYDTQENFNKYHKLSKVLKPYKELEYKGLHHFFASFTNLKPNTKYVLKIVDNNSKSKLMWFKTLPYSDSSRLSVIAGGDSRTRRRVRRKANLMVARLQPDFVIFDGDFTTFDTGSEWKKWLKDWQLTIYNGRLIPIMVVQGNHEDTRDVEVVFDLPTQTKAYYSVTVGKNFLHLIALNTQTQIPGKQTQWFEQDLKQNAGATWTIVAYHKPMRPHYSKKKRGDKQYKYWAPLIYKYHVALVLEGDTHLHKITYAIKPDSTGYQGFVKAPDGTVYTGEGSWGAPLRPADDIKPWTYDAASIDQFKWLWIDQNKIQIRTVLYSSVRKTQQLQYSGRFTIPKGINLRHYNNDGTVFTIEKR